MAKIKKIIAREILDSRGIPTIEAIIQLKDDSVGIFSVPSGTSVGPFEASELRDRDENRFRGQGVLKALSNIGGVLAPKLIGLDAQNQQKIDEVLIETDGTEDKSNLGANTLLALSAAVTKAQAASEKITLYQYVAKIAGFNSHEFLIPTPMFNLINGGRHGSNNLDFQEFLLVPTKANSYSANLKIGVEIYYSLFDTIASHNSSTLVGTEGGYAPSLYSNMDAFKILEEAIAKTVYHLGVDVFFSLDAAASTFKQGGAYRIKDRPTPLPPGDLLDFYIALNEQYHLLSLEDPFNEDDSNQWIDLVKKIGNDTLIVGDDLIATNKKRLELAVQEKWANAVIIKPNQAGTISQTLEVIKSAKKSGFKIIVSHRSGETNDDFIADFAVGTGADYVKFGAPARGERVAKYNRLLEIEHDLS